MQWLKDLIERERKYDNLKLNLNAIETSINEKNTNATIEASKGLIESVCKTICGDLGVNLGSERNLQKLVKRTVEEMPFLKTLNENDANRTKTLCSNIISLSQTISELRNEYGFISHGQDLRSAKKADESVSRLAYSVSDIVCSFLIELHLNFSTIKDLKRIPYEDNENFNLQFDELQEKPIRIGNLEFRPSKVLYNEDFEAYKEELIASLSKKEVIED